MQGLNVRLADRIEATTMALFEDKMSIFTLACWHCGLQLENVYQNYFVCSVRHR